MRRSSGEAPRGDCRVAVTDFHRTAEARARSWRRRVRARAQPASAARDRLTPWPPWRRDVASFRQRRPVAVAHVRVQRSTATARPSPRSRPPRRRRPCAMLRPPARAKSAPNRLPRAGRTGCGRSVRIRARRSSDVPSDGVGASAGGGERAARSVPGPRTVAVDAPPAYTVAAMQEVALRSRTTSPPSSPASATACSSALRERLDCTIRLRGNQLTLEGDDARRRRGARGRRRARRAGRGRPRDRPEHGRRRPRRARPGRGHPRRLRRRRLAAPRQEDRAEDGEPEALRRRDPRATRSRSGSAPPAPARPTWRWRSRSPRCSERQVGRIILTRPAVEAGERLGFLPGRPAREGRPVPAPALRRALRHARRRPADRVHGEGHDRGRAARVHARPDAERLASSSSTRRRTRAPSRCRCS